MELFLKRVAKHLLRHHKSELYSYWLVFPNKRTGLFFKTWLSQLTDDPLFIPPIYSIDEFISYFSSLEETDQLGALFELYHVHQKLTGNEDTFDDFYFWGEMLLNDFDDIDKYLVNAEQLYTNLLNLKEIDQYFMDHEDDAKQHIRNFWEELFKTQKEGTKDFLKTWANLYPVYKAFRQSLRDKNLATKGMIYKDAASQLESYDTDKLPFTRVGFVGFNALTKAEDHIFSELKKSGKADFFWDYSKEMLTTDATSAGYFIKNLMARYPGVFDEPVKKSNDLSIHVTAVSSAAAQATVAGKLIEKMDTVPDLNTAVVMADETLLQTMMNKLPANVQDVNITMGYPLKNSQVSALINHLTTLQQRVRFQKGQALYHYKFVFQLLSNNILLRVLPSIKTLKDRMSEANLFYVPASYFEDEPLLHLIFQPVENGRDVIAYLTSILEKIMYLLNPNADEANDRSLDTEKELIYSVYTRLVRAGDLFGSTENILPGRDLMFKLIKRIADNITLPFEGEPLKGLQLMGILETRNLEFENLIILSTNEGFLPSTSHGNSFIPFNLRKGFGLPTVEEQDAMYAYYFYRLLYRAKNVHLLYDSSSQGINTGEPSRYIYQLKYLSDLNIHEHSVNYEVLLNKTREVRINKNKTVLDMLARYKSGTSSLSASSLNTFLDCGLKFYLSYVERIKEPDEIQDDVDARLFGNVFHDIMETLYADMTSHVVNREDIAEILKNKQRTEDTVKLCFVRNFFKNDRISDTSRIKGKLLIYVKVLLKYTTRMLQFDMHSCPFLYVAGEKQEAIKYALSDGSTVNLFGKIDRVDEKEGTTRILDYKSGSIKVNSKNQIKLKATDALFNREKALAPDQKAIFQTLFYAMLYAKNNTVNPAGIFPGIIPIRSLFGTSSVNPVIHNPLNEPLSYKAVSEGFENHLTVTLDNIFDPTESFSQTPDINVCRYCDFKSICGR